MGPWAYCPRRGQEKSAAIAAAIIIALFVIAGFIGYKMSQNPRYQPTQRSVTSQR